MIYRLKATLPQYRNFLRIYEVRTNATLYAFHLFLQNDLSFAPDQQVFFRVYDKAGHLVRECGLFDTGGGSMDQVRLESIFKKGEETLHYVFDIFKGRYLALLLDGTDEEAFRKSYPRTILERGIAPDQFREEQMALDINFEESDATIADDEDEA